MSSNTISQNPIYNPNINSGCVLWLDATDPNGNGTTVSNGSTISTWVDKSGAGNNASGGVSPSYNSTGINNLGVISFNGSTTYLNSQDLYSNRSFSVFSIVRRQASISSQVAFISGTTDAVNQNFHLCWRINTTLGLGFYGNDIDYTSFPTYTGSTSSEPAYLIEATYTPGSRNLLVNGSIVASDTNSTNLIADVGSRIGGGGSFAGTFFNGFIGEIIVYNGVPNSATRQQAEGYLAWKWGLQGSLPSNHPYKNAAPNFITALPRQFRNLGTIPMAPSLTPFVFGFNPLNIGGCTLWLDAADPSAFVLSGTNITTWRDKSTSANNFSTTAGTATYVNNTVIIPNGAILSASSSISLSTNLYVFIVAQLNTSNFSMALGFTNISPAGSVGDYSIRYFSSILVGSGNSPGNTNDFANANYYVNGNFNPSFGASTYSSIHMISGQSTQSGSTGVTLSSSFNSRYFIGNIYEIIFYSSPPSTAQRQQVEGYLAWKWGLPSQLPSNHPYKNTPPGLSIPVVPTNRQLGNKIFQPTSIAGCQLWLDGQDPNANGSTPSNGATISTWFDKSGNGRNASAGGTSPTYTLSTRGITFGGAGYMNTSYSASLSVESLFVIFNCPSLTNFQQLLGSQLNGRQMFFGSAGKIYVKVTGTANELINSPNSTISNGVTAMIEYIHDGTTPVLYSNGSISVTGTNYAFTAGKTSVLAAYDSGGGYFDPYTGSMFEIIGYYSALTVNQRQSVEGYLAWKWGLQGNLPANHPYKRWPPPP